MVHEGVGGAVPGGTAGKSPARGARFFGIPIDRFGPFSSIVIAVAAGFIAFCAGLFLAIMGLMMYDAATHTSLLNITISYEYVAAPVGLAVGSISMVYLLTVWARRKLAGAD